MRIVTRLSVLTLITPFFIGTNLHLITCDWQGFTAAVFILNIIGFKANINNCWPISKCSHAHTSELE